MLELLNTQPAAASSVQTDNNTHLAIVNQSLFSHTHKHPLFQHSLSSIVLEIEAIYPILTRKTGALDT
jgi:hypothetical protein